MLEKLPSFFKSPHSLSKKNSDEPILLALSGGSDSAALLHLLCELRKLAPFPLYAAHVNHNIRCENFGNEALRDEQFCRKICEKYGVELFVESLNVPDIAKEYGQSLETAARKTRYDFFSRIMLENNIKILVTAHNADDNFETQLFNLCRGCGIDGLCGIPETRPFPEADGIIARPILSATKREITDLCLEKGIEYVTDSTNFEDDCVRNKLRLNIIPLLKEIFGSPERSGARLSFSAKEDSDFIKNEAKNLFSKLGDKIDCTILQCIFPAVAKRVIMMAFEKYSPSSLETVHVESILNFAAEGKNGSISLPNGVKAVFDGGYLSFSTGTHSTADVLNYEIPLLCGINYIPGTEFAVSIAPNGDVSPPTGFEPYASAVVFINSPLYARNRREGDKILAGGMHKRIKKLMCDKKIPLRDRDLLPLIFSGEELIYAPLCSVSDSAKAETEEKNTITIYKKI